MRWPSWLRPSACPSTCRNQSPEHPSALLQNRNGQNHVRFFFNFWSLTYSSARPVPWCKCLGPSSTRGAASPSDRCSGSRRDRYRHIWWCTCRLLDGHKRPLRKLPTKQMRLSSCRFKIAYESLINGPNRNRLYTNLSVAFR